MEESQSQNESEQAPYLASMLVYRVRTASWLQHSESLLESLTEKLKTTLVPPSRLVLPLPPNIRTVDIYGAKYAVIWEHMGVGDSVFFPTSAHVEFIEPQLKDIRRALGFNLVAQQRCEFGKLGIRVWRLA